MRSRFLGLVWAFAAVCLTAGATTPLGYVAVSGSYLTDFSGNLISNATITWAPVSNAGVPIPARINGAGQGIVRPVTATVTGGAFTITVADTMLTSPQNLCYAVTVTDKTTGDTLLSTGYSCVQPAGSGTAVTGGSPWCTAATGSVGGSCNFDNYVPNVAGQAVVQTGPTGPQGPAGPSIAGLSSDSANGINVAGAVTASKVEGVMYAAPALACDGVTDDSTAFQAQVTAAETAGTVLVLPPNKTCLLKTATSVTGTVLWQGNNSTLSYQLTTLSSAFINASAIARMDIGGITFVGSSNTVGGIIVSGGTNQNINIHNNTFTGITGCPANPNSWQNVGIQFVGTNNVKIKDNQFLASGCSSYWSTGGPWGIAVYNYPSTPSYRWEISGNTVDNTYAEFGFLLFNVFESTVHDNDIRDVALGGTGGGDDANSSGYGVAIYGTQMCGLSTLASPSGLSRTSNVTTFNFSGTCSPALVVGDHIRITGSTSVGGTLFDGAYTVLTGGTTSVTASPDNGVVLANDTGGGGNVAYSPWLDTVHDNRFFNLQGIGIYLQGVSNSTANNNTFVNVCQSMNDATIPCGFVTLNGVYQSSATGNVGSGSVKDGVVALNSVGSSVLGNDFAGVGNAAFRMRGADTSETWIGNTSNGAHFNAEMDGATSADVLLGNAFLTPSGDAVNVGNSSALGSIIAANTMNGSSLTPSTTAILSTTSGFHLIALNYIKGFRNTDLDIRGPDEVLALNYIYGAGANPDVNLSSSGANYTLATNNYLFQPVTGFTDTGTSNVIRDNYFSAPTTALGTVGGVTWGNHLKGGSSGVYPVNTCTLVAGTCTISTAEVQSTDSGKIYCTRGSTGANPGFPYVSAITAGTSFVVTSTNASDTGNVGCRIQH